MHTYYAYDDAWCVYTRKYPRNKSDWTKTEICEGYFFFVAIDSMMRPIPIPQFVVENEEEQIEWNKAEKIRTNMIADKSE